MHEQRSHPIARFALWLGVVSLLIRASVPAIGQVGTSGGVDSRGSWTAPPGFSVELAAGADYVRFPMFATGDDRGGLYVAESSGLDLYEELQKQTRLCRVSRLEDVDGDGHFDSSRVFADGLVFPMGLAWRDGKLYVADPPNLLVLQDQDNDGRAEHREILLSGFGHLDNGSLHGLAFGPDDRLYFTLGEPDGYSLTQPDGSRVVGKNGALFAIDLRTKQIEVICRGFTNLVEVEFLADGAIMGTDNWFQLPQQGLRDALVHLAPGGLYPRNSHRDETPYLRTGELLPAATMLPVTGVSGLVRYRGSVFPKEMQSNLFSAQHNTRRVQRHVVLPQGETYLCENHDFLESTDPNVHPSDVLEDADGSLLIVDTGAWYVQHCPTGRVQLAPSQGAIYRVRYQGEAPLHDPRGEGIAWSTLSSKELLELLKDARSAVVERAARRLESRGDVLFENSLQALEWLRDARQPVQQRLLWLLSTQGEDATVVEVLENDALANSPALQASGLQALRGKSAPGLHGLAVRRLAHPDAAVRRAAADVLAESDGALLAHRPASAEAQPAAESAAATEALLHTLRQPCGPFLRHALVRALHQQAPVSTLRDLLGDSHPAVRRGALTLLEQTEGSLQREQLANLLDDEDEEVRTLAVRALAARPDWVDLAEAQVSRLCHGEAWSEQEEELFRALVQPFQSSSVIEEEVTQLMERLIASPEPADHAWAASLWQGISKAVGKDVPEGWKRVAWDALASDTEAVCGAAAKFAVDCHLYEDASIAEQLQHLLEFDRLPLDVSFRVIRALASSRGALEPDARQWVLLAVTNAERPLDRLTALEILAEFTGTAAERVELFESARQEPLAALSLVRPALLKVDSENDGEAALRFLLDRVLQGAKPDQEIVTHVLAMAGQKSASNRQTLIDTLAEQDERRARQLSDWLAALDHGDPRQGERIFFGQKGGCSVCHAVAGMGGEVGPELTGVGVYRSSRDLLESIAFPSSTIAQGYETFVIVTNAGETVTGVVRGKEDESITVLDVARNETRIARSAIESMQPSQNSIMPDGLASKLTRQELVDLVAWLRSLRSPRP